MSKKKLVRGRLSLWLQRFAEDVLLRRRVERIYLLFGGHIFFQTVAAATELDLFTTLKREGGMTRQQIAERLGIEDKPCRILLLGCTSLGLLKKRRDRYLTTAVARMVMTSDNPRSILPIIQLEKHIIYRPMHHFMQALRENRNVGLAEYRGDEDTLYARLAHHPELEVVFQDAVEAISAQSNEHLTRHVDFSQFQRVVDVGGGNGANAMELARRFPGLKTTIFDLPSVCRIADEHIAQAGMQDRVDTFAGNCFDDPFPTHADCFLFCHFCTIWSEEKDQLLLRKAYEALPEGGACIIFNMMQHNDETGPLSAALGSPYFLTLATGEGMLYTWNEYEEWMRQAGFSRVVTEPLVRHHGVIIGIK